MTLMTEYRSIHLKSLNIALSESKRSSQSLKRQHCRTDSTRYSERNLSSEGFFRDFVFDATHFLSAANPGEIVKNEPIAERALREGFPLEGPWTFDLKGVGKTVAYKYGPNIKASHR
jgi:hypothetical protein